MEYRHSNGTVKSTSDLHLDPEVLREPALSTRGSPVRRFYEHCHQQFSEEGFHGKDHRNRVRLARRSRRGPGGGEEFEYAGWSFEIDRGDEGNKFKVDETFESEALLLGRKTYERFAAAWP